MKKVMIAAVILLPLIILMVLLISGTVVGSVQHIYVESIEFTEEGTLVLVKDSEEPPQATLSVNVFPRAAVAKLVLRAVVNADLDPRQVVKVVQKLLHFGEVVFVHTRKLRYEITIFLYI